MSKKKLDERHEACCKSLIDKADGIEIVKL
jgi:hypothetical protein